VTDFGRLVTAMVTPFDDNLEVNWEQLQTLVDYLIEEQKSESLVVCGTTGESPTLTDDERKRLVQSVVRLAGGRAKVIAGASNNDTLHSVQLSLEAEEAGADGVLIVAPYYNRPSQRGIYEHYKAIAKATKLPIMMYNIPSRCGINVEVETTVRLANEFENIVASKEAHGDLDHITALVAQAPSHLRVYCGDDSLTLPYLSVGAHGVVSVASHVVGPSIRELVEAYVQGDPVKARKVHHELFPIFRGMFNCPHRVPNPAPVKHALNLKGVQVGGLRLPMLAVDEGEGKFIEDLLKNL
jgi:4-hydroxy-tetrahydrodipicolinate synthase